MYTTRRLHPKTCESYLSIGDPYDKQRNSDQRYKGKQFQTNPAKLGQLGLTKITHQADSYQDTNGYRVTQPRGNRRLGFGSYDARRRDEFTLDIRAQQYKELLSRENQFLTKYTEEMKTRRLAEGADNEQYEEESKRPYTAEELDAELFQTQVPQLLFDIGKQGGTTPICNKCERDTFYCKHRVGTGTDMKRRQGPVKTSSQIVGGEIKVANKPQYGRKSHIKEFYDANHLSVSQH